jgi:hypothetical protein
MVGEEEGDEISRIMGSEASLTIVSLTRYLLERET